MSRVAHAMLARSELGPGIVQLTLCRAARRNALDAQLVAELHAAVTTLGADGDCRVIVLAAEGPAFCAGADLDEMRACTADAGAADARRLAALLRAWHECPKPTVALVQGDALGGGIGLIAASDIAIGVEGARFRLPEVRLGLLPAVISPYVVTAVGPRTASRLMLAAGWFDAAEAARIGLLHEVVCAAQLASAGMALATDLARGLPVAMAECKRLLRELPRHEPGNDRDAWTAALLAARRADPATRALLATALAGERS